MASQSQPKDDLVPLAQELQQDVTALANTHEELRKTYNAFYDSLAKELGRESGMEQVLALLLKSQQQLKAATEKNQQLQAQATEATRRSEELTGKTAEAEKTISTHLQTIEALRTILNALKSQVNKLKQDVSDPLLQRYIEFPYLLRLREQAVGILRGDSTTSNNILGVRLMKSASDTLSIIQFITNSPTIQNNPTAKTFFTELGKRLNDSVILFHDDQKTFLNRWRADIGLPAQNQ